MKFTKKLFFLLAIVLIVQSTAITPHISASYTLPFEINSEAVYLVNTDTDTVIYEQNADMQIYPASITKVMTAILAIELIEDLEGTVITVPSYIYNEFAYLNVSTADIRRDEVVRMIDVLYAHMLQSACEASSIIADYLGDGSIPDFVELMNQKAYELGAYNTKFDNAHGLYSDDNYSTAKDLYIITSYAMQNPLFEKISSTVTYEMPATNIHTSTRTLVNTNKLLSPYHGGDLYYQYAVGGKTGYLPESGLNLVSTATKNGYNYMLVTIGAPYGTSGSFVDAAVIYDWAFANFEEKLIISQYELVDEVRVELNSEQDYVSLETEREVVVLLPVSTSKSAIQQIKTLAEDVQAPVQKGDVLGYLELKLNGETIDVLRLIATENVERSFTPYAMDITDRFFSNALTRTLLWSIGILSVILAFFHSRYKAIKNYMLNKARKNHL